MSRYIDADALCKALMTRWNTADQNAEKLISEVMADIVTPIVVGIPTADVVPTEFHDKCMKIEIEKRRNMVDVVRCKDCSNWDIHWVSSLFSENVHYCVFIGGPCNGEFYCGAAIKRLVLGGDKD